jgi:hypothetical protein
MNKNTLCQIIKTYTVFIIILLSACSYSPRGPYLQTGTDTSIVVKWVSEEKSLGTVYFGLSENQLDRSVSDSGEFKTHEVTLTGLDADTRYYYRVESADGAVSAVHSFVTAPVPGEPHPTRVWLIGDSGTANENAAAVRDNFYDFNGGPATDVWIMLGDNAYDTGTYQEYEKAVFDMYPDTLATTVVWPTIGNHDAASYFGAPYFDIFSLPRAGEAGGIPSGTEAYYSFDYANIHFICLNSETVVMSKSGPMYSWLETDLQANSQDWTVVYFHQPPYSKGSHDTDDFFEVRAQQIREIYTPLFDLYGVDLVFSGHSHSYERSFPVAGHTGLSRTLTEDMIKNRGDGREDGDGAYVTTYENTNEGVVYTVAGSSGKVSGGTLDHPVHLIAFRELGSVVLDFNGNRVDATFLSPKEGIEDHFTIIKTP